MPYRIYLAQLFTDFVDFIGSLERTYGKGRGEVVKAHFFGKLCRAFKSESVASEASLPALFFAFKTFYRIVKLLGVKLNLQKSHRILKVHLADKTSRFITAKRVFALRVDIGIVKIKSNLKILRQILETITTAGCTAGVEQKCRHLTLGYAFY